MHPLPTRSGLALPLALALGACGGGDDEPELTCIEKATCALEIVSGDGQSGVVAEPLGAPLVVRVTDEAGAPASVTVTWTPGEGGGGLASMTTSTDDAGEASVEGSFGRQAGAQTFEAQIEGLDGPSVTFSVTARPAAGEQIEALAGGGQTGTAGEALPSPLEVAVTDRFGNRVPGVAITWRVVAGMGDIVPGPMDQAETDETGVSSARPTLGPLAGEENNVFTATPQSFRADPVVFIASARAGAPAALTKVTPDQQLGGQPGETLAVPLAVRVLDANMNPVQGATVTYAVLQGMGAALSETSPLTDARGEAEVRATLGPEPGAYAFTAEVGGIMGSPQTFRATAFPPICSPTGWCWENPLPQGNDLFGAWAASETAAWVVGESGTALRYNGAAWVSEASNVQATLRDVHGASPSLVVAVGDGGTIVRSDGTTWRPDTSATNVDLAAVWLASATEGWAVGRQGAVLRFDGASWTAVAPPTQENLRDVHGLSPTEVWAVGERGTFLRFDGTSWAPVGAGAVTTDLNGVWAVSATEVWVVGDGGEAYAWDGSSLVNRATTASTILEGLWRSPRGTLYAFGLANELERWDGRRWINESKPGSAGTKGIRDMLDVDGSPLAVGDDGRFIRQPAGARRWENEAVLGDDAFGGIWGARDDRVWMVSENGRILDWDGEKWTETRVPSRPDFRAVTGTSATDVWAVGTGGAAYRFDGSTWTEVRTPVDGELLAVHALAPNDVFAVGGLTGGGIALRFDGATWSRMTLPPSAGSLRGVYGARPDEVWAVGGFDQIFRWDGASWSEVMAPTNDSALQGVRGLAANDIWAWGSGSTLLHYDGSAWTTVQSGQTGRINDLWLFSRDEAIAVGELGRVLVRAGGRGFRLEATEAATELFGVWGASPGDVWAGGRAGALLRRER